MRKVQLLIALALSAAVWFAANPASANKDAATEADNTKMNKQESKEMTADQQGENETDRKITQNIRRAVVKNKSLSQYAHNVKIITKDGAVTLKGPVRTVKEKKFIEKAAAQVAGKDYVTSEIEVVPAK
jgi:hyperosmotically inducible periplasmic protein